MRDTSLANLVALHDQVQKLRIAQGNRVAAAERLGKDAEATLHLQWHKAFESIENEVSRSYKKTLKDHPSWKWLDQIHGVGSGLAAMILAEIDFERCDTVSALWRYSGLAVIDGKRERPVKGQKLAYNKTLKRAMYLFAVSQLRSQGPYIPLYYKAKTRYEKDRDWTKLHVHYAALRIPQKVFLSHLWHISRQGFGLSTEGPWIVTYGGDTKQLIDPWSMVKEKS